jgi:hypothetical protein
MSWADTSAGVMKMRNGANSAWISLYELDGTFLASDISLAAGSAAAPSLFFTGDTNTGLFSPGADTVALATAGSNRLHITSGGLVGIGTTGPLELLHVNNASAANTRIRLTNATTGTGSFDGLDLSCGSTGLASLIQWEQQPFQIFTNNGTAVDPRLTITAAGNVGIGTTGPTSKISVVGGTTQAADFSITGNNNASGTGIVASFGAGGAGDPATTKGAYILVGGSSVGDVLLGIDNSYPGIIRIKTNYTTPRDLLTIDPIGAIVFLPVGTERARIDSSGRLLVGTSTSSGAKVDIATSTDGDGLRLWYANTPTGTSGPSLIFSHSNNSGTSIPISSIKGIMTGGAVGAEAGALVFNTATGGAAPTERMRITSSGSLLHGITNPGTDTYLFVRTTNNTVALFDRSTNDGILLQFRQADVDEGSISVSGTTVSYNGAHLSRWSQLPGGATREEILRGTVLSNIDEMCGWGEEDNEQLNRMKVSDVEGDKNVSGVFQCWDDDDDTYVDDFYCAMTGDFIIRIAEGVTVQRGDLLMSAGDGTAKPQDDDIIRSKTIAKVTSTHVTCTYEDGSYCVPCVLMAC